MSGHFTTSCMKGLNRWDSRYYRKMNIEDHTGLLGEL